MKQFHLPFGSCRIQLPLTISIFLFLALLSFMPYLANASSNTDGSLRCYDGQTTIINCADSKNDGSTHTIDGDIPSVIGGVPFP
jgi:hypothetical protein